MDREAFWIDALPDSVWGQVPGGPSAYNAELGELWEYTGSVRESGRVRHEFRHRAHPDFDDARVYAHVLDDDNGPRLDRLVANGTDVPLDDLGGAL